MFRQAVFVIALFSVIASACADWEVIVHEKRRHVTMESLADFYGLKLRPPQGKQHILSTGDKTIRIEPGSREIFINNVKFILCFPVISKNGRILISAMDVTKIIEPVMRPGKIKDVKALRTIVLDAGHGGHDSGATSVHGKEKDFTLDVVLRARKLLQEKGFNVRLTRSADIFIPLETRARFANRFADSIFVSVHFNKSNNPGASGIETFALAPRGVPSMDEENIRYSDLRHNPGNIRDPENIALATLIHSAMLRNLRLYDRGIKRARFVVIRDITVPGVLIEGGFLNHPMDGRSIATPDYRQRMARSVVEAVENYQRLVAGQAENKPSLVITPPTPTPEATPSPELSPSPAPKESSTPEPSPSPGDSPAPKATPSPAASASPSPDVKAKLDGTKKKAEKAKE